MMRWSRSIILLAVLLAIVLLGRAHLKAHPEDFPWTELRVDQPIGIFTGRKLNGLTSQPDSCIGLIQDAGVEFERLAPRSVGRCYLPDQVRLSPRSAQLSLSPATIAPSCPVMASLLVWQKHVLDPSARRILGSPVATIEHLGSFSCRRMYGRKDAAWSEHATADAIDVSGFVLADGRRISVARDWSEQDSKGQFLRIVRDGACELFSTVLSPDYNAAHQDHFHLDQARRAMLGRSCR